MIPISDDNPTRRRPFMTLLVGLACVVTFLYVQPSGTRSFDLTTEGNNSKKLSSVTSMQRFRVSSPRIER